MEIQHNIYGNLEQLFQKCWVSGSAEMSVLFGRLPSLAMEKVRADSIVFSDMAGDGLFSNINIPKNLGGSLPLQSLGKQATEEAPCWRQQSGHTEGARWKETAAYFSYWTSTFCL